PVLVPPASAEGASPAAPVAEPSPDLASAMADLHWLVQQGHVIEFANGVVETAKKPVPRPQKAPRPAGSPPATATTETAPADVAPADATPTEGEVVGLSEPLPTAQAAEAPPVPPEDPSSPAPTQETTPAS